MGIVDGFNIHSILNDTLIGRLLEKKQKQKQNTGV